MVSAFYKIGNVVVVFMLLGLVLSCNKNKSKNTISEEKVIPLMIDLLLLEANYSFINVQAYNTNSSMMDSLYALIYKKHHTDSTAFKQTLEYYSKKPDKYIELMEKVKRELTIIDSLSLKKYGKQSELSPKAIHPLDIQKAMKDSMRIERKRKIFKELNTNN